MAIQNFYNGEVFSEIDMLISYLYQKQSDFDHHAKKLMENQYFYAWLIQLGYESHIEKWRSILTN